MVWIYYPGAIAVIVNLALLYFLITFGRNGLEIWKRLFVPDAVAVTGQFTDFSAYEKMPDLDRINKEQEEKMQSQKLIDERQSTQRESSAFDFGIVNAIKRVFNN